MLGNFSSSTEPAVQIRLLDEAQHRFEAEDAWWRANRDATNLFAEEFAATLGRVSRLPEVGQHYRLHRGKLIQRWLMRRTRCHIYYFYDREREVIEVHTIWGARLRRGPTLETER
jgi:hypothetical protein